MFLYFDRDAATDIDPGLGAYFETRRIGLRQGMGGCNQAGDILQHTVIDFQISRFDAIQHLQANTSTESIQWRHCGLSNLFSVPGMPRYWIILLRCVWAHVRVI